MERECAEYNAQLMSHEHLPNVPEILPPERVRFRLVEYGDTCQLFLPPNDTDESDVIASRHFALYGATEIHITARSLLLSSGGGRGRTNIPDEVAARRETESKVRQENAYTRVLGIFIRSLASDREAALVHMSHLSILINSSEGRHSVDFSESPITLAQPKRPNHTLLQWGCTQFKSASDEELSALRLPIVQSELDKWQIHFARFDTMNS